MKLPLEKTWWIEPGKIIGGRYPGSKSESESRQMLQALVDFGVELFVNLQEPDELGAGAPFPDYSPTLRKIAKATGKPVNVTRFPIPDMNAPTEATMGQILELLEETVGAGKLVYVHCWGGHGRTGTVAGCWMVSHGLSFTEALDRIKKARAHDNHLSKNDSPQASSQFELVQNWKKHMKSSKPKAPAASKRINSPEADRLYGALLGLATGDAVGTTSEFKSPGTFKPISDMVGGGPFGLDAGQWTDDTSMALCIAESLVERQAFDPVDQLQRFVRWWKKGHLSSTGSCFDIGNQTSSALADFQKTGKPRCGPTGPQNAGNGSLMRLAPVAMAYWRDPETAIDNAAESSRTTHGCRECVDACRYFAGLLVGAIRGESKAALLGPMYHPGTGTWDSDALAPKIAKVAEGSFHKAKPPLIRGTGYVVDALEAALWAFATTDSFEAAILRAANLGDDADTTAAICGQIAGAFYGSSGIPARWLKKLAKHDLIDGFCVQLSKLDDP